MKKAVSNFDEALDYLGQGSEELSLPEAIEKFLNGGRGADQMLIEAAAPVLRQVGSSVARVRSRASGKASEISHELGNHPWKYMFWAGLAGVAAGFITALATKESKAQYTID